MATCRQDGRLLVPDWPAKAAPIQMLKMAFSDSLPNPRVPHALGIGEIWSTQTTLNERYVYPLLFCSEVGDFEAASWKSLALTDPKLNNSEEYLLYSHSKLILIMNARESKSMSVHFEETDLKFLKRSNVNNQNMQLLAW